MLAYERCFVFVNTATAGLYSCSGEMVGPGKARGRVRGNQPSRVAGRVRVTIS